MQRPSWREYINQNQFNLANKLSVSYFTDSSIIDLFFRLTPFVAVAFISLSLLFFGLFIEHTGELTRFLHRIGASYFIFVLISFCHGVFIRYANIEEGLFFDFSFYDSVTYRLFFFYSTILLIMFFFGISERFFLSKRAPREFALLVLFIYLGGLFVIQFSSFIDILLGLEMVTLASYILVSFERQNRFSTYAAIQYFLVGSIPSARLLLGFSFFYLHSGSLVIQDLDLLYSSVEFYEKAIYGISSDSNVFEFLLNERSTHSSENVKNPSVYSSYAVSYQPTETRTSIASRIDPLLTYRSPYSTLTRRGFFFIRFNLFFKLTAAPFHFWAPSVYGNAPMASVTFLSIYSKIRVFFFLYVLTTGFLHFSSDLLTIFFIFCGILSIFVGRVGAFTEKRIKRFFVFSSRGHVGFILLGFSLSTYEGLTSVFHYVPVYRLTSFLRWFILLSSHRKKTYLVQFSNLKERQPLMATLFAILLFSRSGIPPFAGFFIKFDILSAFLNSGHLFFTYIVFFFTVASFFYYLRVIKILFYDVSNQTKLPKTIYSFSDIELTDYPHAESRYRLIACLSLFLVFYLFFIEKSSFVLQNQRLVSRFSLYNFIF